MVGSTSRRRSASSPTEGTDRSRSSGRATAPRRCSTTQCRLRRTVCPFPVGLGFMTGGNYTENQNAMEDLSSIPRRVHLLDGRAELGPRGRGPSTPGLVVPRVRRWRSRYPDVEVKPEVTQNLVDFFRPLL